MNRDAKPQDFVFFTQDALGNDGLHDASSISDLEH